MPQPNVAQMQNQYMAPVQGQFPGAGPTLSNVNVNMGQTGTQPGMAQVRVIFVNIFWTEKSYLGTLLLWFYLHVVEFKGCVCERERESKMLHTCTVNYIEGHFIDSKTNVAVVHL